MPRIFRFFICTRNRPKSLEQCVLSVSESIHAAFPASPAYFYVFDDSTSLKMSHHLLEICKASKSQGLEITIIRNKEKNLIFKEICEAGSKDIVFLYSLCKQLGRGGWDLASIRNFAFVFACLCSHDDDLLVFLDDDICFHSSIYQGHFVPIEGSKVLQQLDGNTSPGALIASGTSYFGRFDAAIHDHLEWALADLLTHLDTANKREQTKKKLREIALFPKTLPVRLNLPGDEPPTLGPGISGAVLATTRASLRSHYLPRFYNEDWIWLSLLGSSNTAIKKVEASVLHAAPPQKPISSGFFVYQIYGDITYTALKYMMEGIPDGMAHIEWCRENISTEHFAFAKQNTIHKLHNIIQKAHESINSLQRVGLPIAADSKMKVSAAQSIETIIKYVDHALASIYSHDTSFFHQKFLSYIKNIPLWRDAIEGVTFQNKMSL